MLIKRLCKIFCACFVLFVLSFFAQSNKINATYWGCNKPIENTTYYDCGDKIYTYYHDRDHSSIVYALKGTSIVYAGMVGEHRVFYTNGFYYFNSTYDDRSSEDNNLWTTLTKEGTMVFSGEFEDSWMLDETHSGYYNEADPVKPGVYEIIQYHKNGEVYRKLLIYNIEKTISKVYKINIDSLFYDDTELPQNVLKDVVELENGVSINVTTSFGIEKFSMKVNGKNIASYTVEDGCIKIGKKFADFLNKGVSNTIEVYVKNYLGYEDKKVYYINALSNEALISFSSISSEVISSSRRIVVNASAGLGRELDRDYCWYYWSTSPDDSLRYEDFLVNYAKSEYKGSYSKDKGVILRNTTGVYYLYALAKDDESYTVSRSEGYTLNDSGIKISYSIYDAIYVVSLLIVAILPISIYLFIRKRGY